MGIFESVRPDPLIKQMGDYRAYPYSERVYPGVDRTIARALLSDVSRIPPYDPNTDPEFNAGWVEGALPRDPQPVTLVRIAGIPRDLP